MVLVFKTPLGRTGEGPGDLGQLWRGCEGRVVGSRLGVEEGGGVSPEDMDED